ncbi:MAG: N-acetylglucosamine kinase [Lachnospiraceae bacterium]|jgi:N-acetylglucosamine kinase-like BadF-type ATPase
MLKETKREQKFVIGIDSGGTNYRVKACDFSGDCLGYAVGEPSNYQYLGKEELIGRIEKNLQLCLQQFGGSLKNLECLVCGTTGIDSEEDLARLIEIYHQIPGVDCPIYLMNDAELAHYTVTGGEGVLLIAGTGSIAVGKNREGKTARAGGWPLAILGDEGSGTWVTKMALRHVGRWLDEAAEKTVMVDLICRELKIGTRDELIQMSLDSGINPAGLPQLGKLVNQAAAEGDVYAKNILTEAAEHLMGLIRDIGTALDLNRTEPDFKLGLWGSCILKSPIIMEHFTALLKEEFPQARICLPEKEAIDGAIEMALEKMGR